MATFTPREHLEDAPALASNPDSPTAKEPGWAITRAITLAKCLRCGFEWMPRVACPARCPHCKSPLWNIERAQQLPGKPAPTRKGKPRGKPLQQGDDPRRSSRTRRDARANDTPPLDSSE